MEELALVELNSNEYEKVIEKLKDYFPSSVPIYGILSCGIKTGVLKCCNGKAFVPNQKDFPLFVAVTYDAKDMTSLTYFWDEEKVDLETAYLLLKSLPNFKWTVPNFLCGIKPSIHEQVLNILKTKGKLNVPFSNKCDILIHNNARVQEERRTKYVIDDLSKSHAKLIHSHWEYNSFVPIELMESTLHLLPSSGAFCTDSNSAPVSWSICKFLGDIGMTHTLESHRRKGLATAVTLDLAEKMRNRGMLPFIYIVDDNTVSKIFHEKIGFENVGIAHFTICQFEEN